MANKRVAIIASNGGLDSAYKVLNIATAAASVLKLVELSRSSTLLMMRT